MKVEYTRLLILLICLIIRVTDAVGSTKREQCRDFAGDRSNCQRFIRCFHNLRVLFTCASGTAYVPELQTCVARELVTDCDDSKNRVEVTVNSNTTPNESDDYPTIEADLNALEAPTQKSLSSSFRVSVTPRQFGCSSYCYNQGTCVLVGQSITCRCSAGFIGIRCQVSQSAINTRLPDCSSSPCAPGSTCENVEPSTFRCQCPPTATGPLCDIPINGNGNTTTGGNTTLPISGTCTNNICLHGGICYTLTTGGFFCNCTGNYTGPLCEVPGSATLPSCATNSCQNGGTCTPTSSGYQCQCSLGFSGSNCQNTALSIRNSCQPSPCQNGGTCYLTANSFACACPNGFSGTCCELTLAASNPCLANPCTNMGTCQVIGTNVFRCVCPNGFVGVRCEQRICDPNPCLYGGSCLPYGNSFVCQCPPQYTGRCCELLQITTAPPNPCNSGPCLNGGTCSATSATAFICSCTSSYYGRCCELRNYCQPNPCYNGGTCVATSNAYICQCTYPNSGSNCEMVLATRAPQPTCACVLCPCPTQAPVQTNPCLPNPCQNNGGCSVVQNTAQCYCQPQFTGYYCQFTRKRALSNAPCANITCLNGGECYINENGPQCTCPKPYFGERCELINRPRTCNPSPCGKNGQCISTKDGYKCVCKNGITGILCEQTIMPKNYRWCPLDCRSGTTCVYEGSTPKCRVLSVH